MRQAPGKACALSGSDLLGDERFIVRVVGKTKATLISGVATALAFSVGGVVVAFPADAVTAYVATANVNVRSGPSTAKSILGVLPAGAKVTATGAASNGWVPITFEGKPGYVSTTYVKVSTTTTSNTTLPAVKATMVTKVNVNVRTAASLTSDIVSVLKAGTTIGLTGKVSGLFSEIILDSKLRWLYTTYLADPPGPAIKGTAITQAVLAMRSAASITASSAGDLPQGTKVGLTGVNQASYTQIVVDDKVSWVLSGYLKVSGTDIAPLPTAVGKRYINADGVRVRAGASTGTTVVDTVSKGTVLLITGVTKNGYSQVIYAGALRWTYSTYLSRTLPTTTSTTPTSGSLGSTSLDRTNAYAKSIVLAIRAKFPQIKTIYGWRMYSAYSSDHPNGRALDIMIPSYSTASGKALGDAIARYLQENHAKHHVHYLIWRQRNWNVERNLDYTTGWRWMSDRGGATANHYDHVHVSVYAAPTTP